MGTHVVNVTLTDEEFETAGKEADRLGISLALYVKRYPISADEFDLRYDQLKYLAKCRTNKDPYTVMELFGSEWNNIPRGIRLSLGRTFYHAVRGGRIPGVSDAGKNASNLQLYVTIS